MGESWTVADQRLQVAKGCLPALRLRVWKRLEGELRM